jgi:hypothetical protein
LKKVSRVSSDDGEYRYEKMSAIENTGEKEDRLKLINTGRVFLSIPPSHFVSIFFSVMRLSTMRKTGRLRGGKICAAI